MIAIDTQINGSFKVYNSTTGSTFLFSALDYASKNGEIELIPAAGSGLLPLTTPYTALTVNGVTAFASAQAACSALDVAGVGGSKTAIYALPARGEIVITGTPADEDTVTLDDGTKTPVVFEFSGAKSAGSITFVNDATPTQPSDGDTIILDAEGDFEKTFEFNAGRKFSATLSFIDGETAENVVDGNLLTVVTHNASKTFVFLDTPAEETAYNEVEIGETAAATMANFITKFNAVVTGYTAIAADTPDHTCTIQANAVGIAFYFSISTDGTYIKLTNVVVGLEPGDNITAVGNIGVPIMTTVGITTTEFVRAWNDNVPNFAATQGAGGSSHVVTITADEIGVAYNVTLTTEGTHITIVEPTGGIDSGTNVTSGQIEVPVGIDTAETASNLFEAINEVLGDGDLDIRATVFESTVYLSNLATGTGGNEAITKSCDAITITGMSGGRVKTDIADILTALAALAV